MIEEPEHHPQPTERYVRRRLLQLDNENLSVRMERATRRCVRFFQGIRWRDVTQHRDVAGRVQGLAQILALLVDVGIDLVGQPIVALVFLEANIMRRGSHPYGVTVEVDGGTPYP